MWMTRGGILCLLFLCLGCKQAAKTERNTERAFYHWKTVYNPSGYEKSRLDSARVNKLYLRFFDVDWNPELKQALPKAQVLMQQKPDSGTAVVPVVFITNECIRALDTVQVKELAVNVAGLLSKNAETAGLTGIDEVQFDCDWTATTKELYFLFLRQVRQQPFLQGKQLSVTIRLYQLKYSDKTGVPPADKGLLMCYNMGNLKNPQTTNSILDPDELNKYIVSLKNYPLPMDLALPLFEWKVLFRKGNFSGLLESLPDDSLRGDFVKKNGHRYTFLQDAAVAGYTFYKGDELRDEKSEMADILRAAQLVSRYLKNTRPVVSLYHLDSVILKKYSSHELETVFDSFN